MATVETVRSRPRAFWADARFLLGIVLIVASVAGVWLVVTAARQTVPVFAAARTIVPGETVAAGDLQVVDVALGHVHDAYAAPGTLEPGAVAMRTIEAGELVPRSAIGDGSGSTTTTIVVNTATAVSASLRAGVAVEVWAAPPGEQGTFQTPRILVPSATVVSIDRADSMIGATGVSIELVIDRADIAAALAAVADGSRLTVVPSVGAGR